MVIPSGLQLGVGSVTATFTYHCFIILTPGIAAVNVGAIVGGVVAASIILCLLFIGIPVCICICLGVGVGAACKRSNLPRTTRVATTASSPPPAANVVAPTTTAAPPPPAANVVAPTTTTSDKTAPPAYPGAAYSLAPYPVQPSLSYPAQPPPPYPGQSSTPYPAQSSSPYPAQSSTPYPAQPYPPTAAGDYPSPAVYQPPLQGQPANLPPLNKAAYPPP